MAKNKDGLFRILFLIAAIYDFILGAVFLFFYKPIYSLFDIVLPAYPMYLQMSAAFVFAMGLGYYFIYKNLYRNIDLVKLGIAYKIMYSAWAGYFFFKGIAHVTFFYFVIFDLVFLVFFILFLNYAKKDARYLKWN